MEVIINLIIIAIVIISVLKRMQGLAQNGDDIGRLPPVSPY